MATKTNTATFEPPFVRNPYNYDTNKAGDESGLKCEDPTLAQQHFKEESDINTIVERFHLTGELPQNVTMPTNMDFDGIFDFQTAMNTIRSAQEAFAKMPANVRYRFHNDPAEFVDFCSDRGNLEEATKLGLVERKPPAEAPTTTPAPQAPAATGTPPAPPNTDPTPKA